MIDKTPIFTPFNLITFKPNTLLYKWETFIGYPLQNPTIIGYESTLSF